MKGTWKNKRMILWITMIIVLFAVYFVINYLTPAIADDYRAMGYWKYDSDGKMHSFSDLFESCVDNYYSWSGRILSHLTVMLFCYLPPVVFDVLNSCMCMLVSFLIYKICMAGKKDNIFLFAGIHILLWLSVPDYGQVFFWTSGSGNYLWTSFWILLAILIFRKYAVQNRDFCLKKWHAIITIPIGVLAGAAMENMSAGMIVILTLYLVYYKKMKIKICFPILGAYVGSILGFAFLMLAPGNRVRSNAEAGLSFVFKLFIFSYYWVIFIAGLCIIWFLLRAYIRAYRQEAAQIHDQSAIFLLGAVCSAGCLVFAPTLPERAWYIACVFLIIALGIYFVEIDLDKQVLARQVIRILSIGAAIYCLISAADTVLYSMEIYKQTKLREEYILQEKEKGNLDITVPIITHRYPLRSHHDALTGLSDIQENPEYWINQEVARYYGVNTVTGEKDEYE